MLTHSDGIDTKPEPHFNMLKICLQLGLSLFPSEQADWG